MLDRALFDFKTMMNCRSVSDELDSALGIEDAELEKE